MRLCLEKTRRQAVSGGAFYIPQVFAYRFGIWTVSNLQDLREVDVGVAVVYRLCLSWLGRSLKKPGSALTADVPWLSLGLDSSIKRQSGVNLTTLTGKGGGYLKVRR